MSVRRRKPLVTVTPRLYTELQAANYLGLKSADTVKRMAIAGQIPVCKVIGRGTRATRMYDKADLDHWIESNKGLLAY